MMDKVVSDAWQGPFYTSGVTSSWQSVYKILQLNEGNQRMEGAAVKREMVSGVRSSAERQHGRPGSSDWNRVQALHKQRGG